MRYSRVLIITNSRITLFLPKNIKTQLFFFGQHGERVS